MAKLTKSEKELLQNIIDAGEGGTFAPELEVEGLVKAGLVEIADIHDSYGNIAVRAITKGENKNMETTEVKAGEFVIESGIDLPKSNQGGAGNTKYPFDKLEVGQSFFIPGKDAKSLGGTVSAANARYAKETGAIRVNRKGNEVPETVATRLFVCRAVEGGSRIWRTQ